MPPEPFAIKNWSVRYHDQSPYTAPESRGIALVGTLDSDGHPSMHRGDLVITSPITFVDPDGRTVTTYNGTRYRAEGEPERGYIDWLHSKGKIYDPKGPIRMVW